MSICHFGNDLVKYKSKRHKKAAAVNHITNTIKLRVPKHITDHIRPVDRQSYMYWSVYLVHSNVCYWLCSRIVTCYIRQKAQCVVYYLIITNEVYKTETILYILHLHKEFTIWK